MSPTPLDLRSYVAEKRAELATQTADPAFPPSEYKSRLDSLRAAMADSGIDLLLLTSPEAICWLHGFTCRWNKVYTSSAWPALQTTAVHVNHDRFIVFESGDHAHTLRLTSISTDNRFFDVYDAEGMIAFIMRELAAEGWLRGVVGLEKQSPVPSPYLSQAVEEKLVSSGLRVVDAGKLTRDVRRIKSPLELEAIREAARICDVGLDALARVLKPGVTELECWAEMVHAMAAEGGEPGAMHETVSPLGAGYTISSRRTFEAGQYLFADPTGVYHRYHANIARTFWLGEPTREALRLADIEAGSFDVLRTTAKAGTPVRDVNRALREYYEEAGVSGLGWAGGYELGIAFPPDKVGEFLFEVDEETPEAVIEAGMVTNFENLMHVINIDTVVYEADGARTLSRKPFDIVVVD